MNGIPASLERAMQNALAAAAPQDDDRSMLTRGAVAALKQALADCNDRTAALPLLAADALVTAACAAADADGLERLADELSPQRLAALLDA